MKKISLFLAAVALTGLYSSQAFGASYFATEGIYMDANKSLDDTDDDLMCWAASAANILAYTGWGSVLSDSESDIFEYYQTYWQDTGGNPYEAITWWFTGENLKQGADYADMGWSQLEVEGGGGFYDADTLEANTVWSADDETAMENISSWLQEGYGVSVGLAGTAGHAITVWGYDYDDNGDYLGIWITDSDDGSDGMQYYEVVYQDGQWVLQDFYSDNGYYIDEVFGLASSDAAVTDETVSNPSPVPVPGTALLLCSGMLGLTLFRRKSSAA